MVGVSTEHLPESTDGWGWSTSPLVSRGGCQPAAYVFLLLLTCARLMTSSHFEGLVDFQTWLSEVLGLDRTVAVQHSSGLDYWGIEQVLDNFEDMRVRLCHRVPSCAACEERCRPNAACAAPMQHASAHASCIGCGSLHAATGRPGG